MTNKEIIEGLERKISMLEFAKDQSATQHVKEGDRWDEWQDLAREQLELFYAAISALNAGEWVEIDKVPESWESPDGATFPQQILLEFYGKCVDGWPFISSGFTDLSGHIYHNDKYNSPEQITHARLPQLPGDG